MLTDDEKWALISELAEFLKDQIYRTSLKRAETLIEQLEAEDPDFGFLHDGATMVEIIYEVKLSTALLEAWIGKYRRRGIKKTTHEITFNLPNFINRILKKGNDVS